MKLYYSPGVCSLCPHIVLEEAGLKYELEKVDLQTKKTESDEDFLTINPKGSVPLLVLDDGEKLTEVSAIVQYLADLVPEKQLIPESGNFARVRMQEWLNYTATELHKNFSPLFNADANQEWKDAAVDALKFRFNYVNEYLQKNDFLIGDKFSVADSYLFTVLSWTAPAEFDLSQWPAIQAFMQRIYERDSVYNVLCDEGLT